MKKISWHPEKTPPDIQKALEHLSIEYPFVTNTKGNISVQFKKISGVEHEYSIRRNGTEVVIEHTTLTAALRAAGSLLADADIVTESSIFSTLGIMLECSRGAVMKVDYLKRWLRKLALMGYNMAMLYTTDTYQLPDEPYFGYLRGPYTQLELKEIDEYAANLGIEMIACFQTLGHMETVLKWDVYQNIRDTKHVMLVAEEKTYQLIEKMIKFWLQCYRSRRVHLGMDESHDIGLGRYLDIHGYRLSREIFAEHLKRVCDICKKYELQPMIWSDMYFRNCSKTRAYYDKDIAFTEDDKAGVLKGVDLVYWDYYHDDEAFYREWINRHRELGAEPIMGGGIWTWRTLWYNRKLTEITMKPCIDACRKEKVKEIFFTMWGDDGSYCDFDSSMAGLAWAAEASWNVSPSQTVLKKRFACITHADYDECLIPSEITDDATIHEKEIWGKDILWDDPILGILWRQVKLQNSGLWLRKQKICENIIARLEKCKTKSTDGGDLYYARIMMLFIHDKICLKNSIDAAYQNKDLARLKSLATDDIPALIERLDAFDMAFRDQWLRRNNHYGLEVMQIRFAGQKRRWTEFAATLQEFVDGKVPRIPDLETDTYQPLPYYPKQYQFLATSSLTL